MHSRALFHHSHEPPHFFAALFAVARTTLHAKGIRLARNGGGLA
jgi:hypothetical protein